MCQGFARCVLIVFNVLFVIFGVLCLGVGIWVHMDKASVIALFRASDKIDTGSYEVPSLFESGAYMLIAVGALVFTISIFGFCGAIIMSRCCLLTYGVLMSVVLLIQVGATIAVAVFKGKFDDLALEFLNKSMAEVYDGPFKHDTIASLALDAMQTRQQCCGVNGQADYDVWNKWNRTWNGQTAKIPVTCCKSDHMDAYPNNVAIYISGLKDANCPVIKTGSYTKNCYNKINDLVFTYYAAILGVGLGVAALELILILVACCIAKNNDETI